MTYTIMKPELKMIIYTVIISAILQTALSGNLFIKSKLNKPTVKVQQGRMQGIREKNVDGNNYYYAFRGIPYAKPPVGKLRFKDPEQVEAWSGVRNAKKSGNVCAQKYFLTQKVIGSDDCLYLNVFTTDLNLNDLKPVMVWIHGGSFTDGSGNDDRFGADYIVQKNVVLVTLNYRLGIFGFLNLDDEEAPGNQGLKDQVMALKWVEQNIAKFGGDPKNVTIFGESAGSSSVHYLTLSPLAQGLFQRAILQNGVATNPWARTSSSMKEDAEKVADQLGNKIFDSKDLIKYLRNVDAQSLINAVESLVNQKNKYVYRNLFVPSVDSKSKHPFLNESVLEAAKSGIKVPHIIGYNSEPAIVLLQGVTDDDLQEIEADKENLLQPNTRQFLQDRNISASDFKRFFMGDKKIERNNVKELVNLASADQFIINIHDTVEMQSGIADVPTYLYKFDHYSKETSVVQKFFDIDIEGTSLLEEEFYLFNAKILEKRGISKPASYPTERIIHQRFIELWTNFAKTGNPNAETSELIPIEWEPVDNSTDYNGLKISEDLSTIGVSNLLHQLQKFAHNRND